MQMHTGTLIDQLMAAVERVEARLRQEAESAEFERWYASVSREISQLENDLVGVA